MSHADDSSAMHWVYRYENGTTVARLEPIIPSLSEIFDEKSFQPTDPEKEFAVRDISTGGRDDFSHAGFRLSDNAQLFTFQLGRPSGRPLTTEEQAANPQCDYACVYQIVDRGMSSGERQLVLEWLQAKEDDIIARLRRAGRSREHALMALESVSAIAGY